MQKYELVSKILKSDCISRETVKYYGLDYPKVFNNFRCSSITDSTSFPQSTVIYDSTNERCNDIDNEMLNILTKRSKLRIITFWEKNVNELYSLENKWFNLFYFYCKKTIMIPYEATDSLIYHLFSGEQKLDMRQIQKIIRTMGISIGSSQKITIFLVEPKYTESDEKLEYLEYTKPTIHVSKNNFDTYQTGCLYFCENSLKHLGYQNLNHFLGPWMRRSRLMFLTIRNVIFNTFTCDNYQHLMLFSSVVLYILGQRAMNDLDMMIYQDFKDFNKANQEAITTLSKYPFVDYSAKGTNKWKHYWDTWLTEWANHSGVKNFNDVLYDADNHFYYFGVKVISIQLDISRRILRNRPASIADLYMLKENLPSTVEIKIPKMKKKYKEYVSIDNLSEDEISKLVEDGYKKKKGELVKKVETDMEHFLETVLSYLVHRYKNTTFNNTVELKKIIYPLTKLRIKIKN
jgi:hypothetical protein